MLGLPRQAVDSPDHSEDDRQLSIAELQGDPLHHVMAHLDTKSLCSAVQVGALVQRFGGCLQTHIIDAPLLCRCAKVGALQVCKKISLHAA